MKNSNILIVDSSLDYELLDSGLGEKLERFGKFILSRPDPQALWSKRLSQTEWKKADAEFIKEDSDDSKNRSGWTVRNNQLHSWSIDLFGIKMEIKPTSFKHVGIFPEQVVNWQWLTDTIEDYKSKSTPDEKGDFEVLNLFGYTGGASLICAKAGAKVVHVDGSKVAITWARKNADLSDLTTKPIRWILDDARTFVKREIKRGRKYNGIIMDPPAFGHGPENELWRIEKDLLSLIQDCMKILVVKPSFFLINGYSAGYSAIAYENIFLDLKKKYGGTIDIGELAIRESEKEGLERRVLPCGIFARWRS